MAGCHKSNNAWLRTRQVWTNCEGIGVVTAGLQETETGPRNRRVDCTHTRLYRSPVPTFAVRGACLTDADLRDAELTDIDLRGADLSDADMTDADLSDATLPDRNPSSTTLDSAILSGTQLNDS